MPFIVIGGANAKAEAKAIAPRDHNEPAWEGDGEELGRLPILVAWYALNANRIGVSSGYRLRVSAFRNEWQQ